MASGKRKHSRKPLALRLLGRLELSGSSGKLVDGLWIGAYIHETAALALARVEEALCLIRDHDRLKYDRLRRDVERILVLPLAGAIASFNSALHLCHLNERYLLAETTTAEDIASTIIHEATHARLFCVGIGYEGNIRARVEAVCVRRQIAFTARLPNGEQARHSAECLLQKCQPAYYVDSAMFDRAFDSSITGLQELGAPGRLIRLLIWSKPALIAVRRSILRLRRASAA
jgi:hypothetical protein